MGGEVLQFTKKRKATLLALPFHMNYLRKFNSLMIER